LQITGKVINRPQLKGRVIRFIMEVEKIARLKISSLKRIPARQFPCDWSKPTQVSFCVSIRSYFQPRKSDPKKPQNDKKEQEDATPSHQRSYGRIFGRITINQDWLYVRLIDAKHGQPCGTRSVTINLGQTLRDSVQFF
jgi:hypothetical protein